MKSLGKFPDPFIEEIAGQPGAMRRAAAGLKPQTAKLQELTGKDDYSTIVFTGMGSSYDACYPAVIELAAAGIAGVMLDSAELLHFRKGILRPGTLLVAVSQSGESAEIVRLVSDLREGIRPPRIASVTNGLDNSLAGLADVALDTLAGPELGPSTMTFAGSLVVLAGLVRALSDGWTDGVAGEIERQADMAASSAQRLLDDVGLPERLVAWFADASAAVILGRGPARAAAEMGALTIKEAAGLPIESLETAQFRHGPLELAGPELAAIVIATEAATRELDLVLAEELLAHGAAVLALTQEGDDLPGAMNVRIGTLDPSLTPCVSILPAQLLAWRLAAEQGREPGRYYRAAKVTLSE